jgi:large conductance mechanosensitive channel
MLKGFRDFLFRGNIIDLAIAVVLGVAFTALIASFVADLLTPLIGAVFGQPDFSALTFTVNGSTFHYGRFINAALSFLFVGGTLYFLVVKPKRAIETRAARGVARPASGREAPPPPPPS